jgi:predicted transcriptional regulator
MSERRRLRSIRLDDELWGKILLAAQDEGRSANQVAAAAFRAYVEGRAEERAGAPEASP